LFYAMDKNVKEKKVVCGMYEKGELVLSNLWWYYGLFWCLLCGIA
jgi:hypothetical protein